MSKFFSEDGLSFAYPDDWELQREDSEKGWTLTLQSPGSAFALIQLDRDMPDPREVVRQALETLRADYPQLEADATIESLAGELAVGHDIQFISLDMITTCWTRSFYGLAGTLFVLCQACGIDAEDYESALHSLCASMRSLED